MKTTPKGRKIIIFLIVVCFIFTGLISKRIFFRVDLTKGQRFSVSQSSIDAMNELESSLRITYYVSSELKKLYPQVRDISDFLRAYASENDFISVEVIDPVKDNLVQSLTSLGILGRQIQSTNGNKTEYLTVYSAILMEYLDKTLLIPFILSTEKLEYELTSRVLLCTQEKKRPVMVMVGNNFSLEKDYSYVLPWLESAGFFPMEITSNDFVHLEKQLKFDSNIAIPLVVLGSCNLSEEEVVAIKYFAESGGNVILFTSSSEVDIYGSWDVKPIQKDFFFPVLNDWGIYLSDGLLCDISCFRINLYSDEENPLYESMNYPFWISILPQYTSENAITTKIQGMNSFWSNSLEFQGDSIEPLFFTSPAAWQILPDYNHSQVFVTNPFLTAQTAKEAGKSTLQAPLAAIKKLKNDGGQIIVVSDQYFLSTMMLDYTGASSNLDFLVNSLLSLSKENALLNIKNKSSYSTTLYKADEQILSTSKNFVLFFTCILMPLLPVFVVLIFVVIKKIKFYIKDKK